MKQFFVRNHLAPIVIIIMFLILGNTSFSQGTQTFTTPGTVTNGFTVPAGVTSITVEVWGGGKGGSVVNNSTETGGGGGGAYSRSVIAVVPGTSFSYTVGGGATTTAAGSDSWFGSATNVMAKGGNSVAAATATGGTGGAAASGFGNTKFNGGNGANATDGSFGGGGGSSAGTGAAGNFTNTTTSQFAGATAPTGGGNGGNGGNANPSNGVAGSAPGGGGGGVRSAGNTTQNGGNGGNGQVKITWTCPSATISYPLPSSLCVSSTSASPTLSGAAGGVFSATPVGLSINSSTGVINPSTSTTGTQYTVHYQLTSSGCPNIDATTTVTAFVLPIASVTNQSNITCNGSNNGTITLSASGGTSPGNTPYTYSVDNAANFQLSPLFQNLLPNHPYRVRVKDNHGCISK